MCARKLPQKLSGIHGIFMVMAMVDYTRPDYVLVKEL